MKIAIWHNLPSGGGKRALYYHVRGLAQRGHQIVAWCPPTADQTYLPLAGLIPEHVRDLVWQSKSYSWSAKRYLIYYNRIANRIKAMQEHCRVCAEEINQGDFDVLFANSCMFFGVAPIANFITLPAILYLGEPFRELYEAFPQLPWVALATNSNARFSFKDLRRFCANLVLVQGLRLQAREELTNVQSFDSVLVNSYFSRESVSRAYGLNSKVCYLGIDTEKFICKDLDREEFAVGVGAIMPHKNIDFVLRALARLSEPRPRLVWVGNVADRRYLEELQALALLLGVQFEPKVRIADDELIDLLNRAAMMVYAPHLEPFGFAPLEANACGLPVVAVAEGGVRETIMDGINGLLVDSDLDSMASAIGRLAQDKVYARKLGQAGRNRVVNNWSLESSIDRLEQHLTNVAAGRG